MPPSCPSETSLLAFSRGELGIAGVDQLDAHIDACEVCRTVVALLMPRPSGRARPASRRPRAASVTRPLPPPRRATAPRLTPGIRLADRYHVKRLIGRGGIGEVYEVEDQLLGESVALKVLSEELAADDRANRRLKREVLLARRIPHPNVCRLFDMGRDADLLFLTMELLPGPTLSQQLRASGRLPSGQERHVIEQLCAGLDAAHRMAIIHRDFKGENVLLVFDQTGSGQTGSGMPRAVITDFGLARAAQPDLFAGADATTLRGTILGTMTHAAPEQLAGAAVTTAVDVYALGVVLYQMVTGGALPFAGVSDAEAVHLRLRGTVPSLRGRVRDL